MYRCEEYQELISAAVDGELTEEELAQVHAHIASCPECRLVYEAFCGLSGALGSELPEPPAELHTGTMLKVRAHAAAAKKRRKPLWRYGAMAACLAVVILGVTRLDMPGEKNQAPRMVEDAITYATNGAASFQVESVTAPEKDALTEPIDTPAEGTCMEAHADMPAAAPLEEPIPMPEAPADDCTLYAVPIRNLRSAAWDNAAPLTDEATLAQLSLLLQPGELCAPQEMPDSPVLLTLELTDGDGFAYSLRLHEAEGVLWYTDGSVCARLTADKDTLFALLGIN